MEAELRIRARNEYTENHSEFKTSSFIFGSNDNRNQFQKQVQYTDFEDSNVLFKRIRTGTGLCLSDPRLPR